MVVVLEGRKRYNRFNCWQSGLARRSGRGRFSAVLGVGTVPSQSSGRQLFMWWKVVNNTIFNSYWRNFGYLLHMHACLASAGVASAMVLLALDSEQEPS